MLTDDLRIIGNRLLVHRKHAGLTQVEVAERAGMSDRTYADIERGTVNMRLSTILRICAVLHITPNEILTDEVSTSFLHQQELFDELILFSNKNGLNPKALSNTDNGVTRKVVDCFTKTIDHLSQ